MLTTKQKVMADTLKSFYAKIHREDTVFSVEYCKRLVKITIDEIYKIYPDKKVGKIAINWFDEKYNKDSIITEDTFCFEINFYDIYTGLPWMICRFYKGVSKVGVYVCG